MTKKFPVKGCVCEVRYFVPVRDGRILSSANNREFVTVIHMFIFDTKRKSYMWSLTAPLDLIMNDL